jgi:hypothetical protein
VAEGVDIVFIQIFSAVELTDHDPYASRFSSY